MRTVVTSNDRSIPDQTFAYSREALSDLVEKVLKYAKQRGASDAVSEVSEGFGLSVTVRQQEVETIERNQDKVLGVTVFFGQQRGNASTSDFSDAALQATVDAACNIARFTAPDPFAGPAEAELLETSPRDLSLFHPWGVSAEHAIELALRAESAAFAFSPDIQNSDGASVSSQQSHFLMGTSRGLITPCNAMIGTARFVRPAPWMRQNGLVEWLRNGR
jgi:PmbA protein